mmetsp:Transcript_3149/g.6357  ORF Transcript_3149/g.6357 Transcript_3149/m.6357 type:complete len:362 (+) Transcript_3149:211-1296(+)
MSAFPIPPLPKLYKCISSPPNPVGSRMRAAYHLKQIYNLPSTTQATRTEIVSALGRELSRRDHGELMCHEIAYVMGQLRDEGCLTYLIQALGDRGNSTIVRHECAEAIGAIGKIEGLMGMEAIQGLRGEEEEVEVRETVEIAIQFIKWRIKGEETEENMPMACACMTTQYDSTDPAPPHPQHRGMSHSELGDVVRDEKRDLWERYRAMFSLRNLGGEEAATELGRALVSDKSSALFRHEVAFVLGQLQHPSGLPYLVECLRRKDEHPFARHEACEAVGAIDGDWEEVERVLKEFVDDEQKIVAESAMVAMDGRDYFGVLGGEGEGGDGGFKEMKEGKKDVMECAIGREGVVMGHFNTAMKA